LLRWQHPRRGLLAPGEFQPALNDPSLRAELGLFALNRVFDHIVNLRDKSIAIGQIAINLTNSDFRSNIYYSTFLRRLAETGIEADKFCFEVTEGMFLGQSQTRVQLGLKQLHSCGAEIALDDFGTGFASLTHLRELPIDRIKIDRSFIENIITSPEDQAIVRGVIDIAKSIGKVVTAEGVETEQQANKLRQMRCDYLQGWYFSQAVPHYQIPKLISSINQTNISQE
jgi:EAL domain-containing protein (putative c-di-GMP-specific phosphodiesterase class I)